MTADEIKSALYQLIDMINFYDRMMQRPNCNTCAKKRICEYVDWGAPVVYNCPHFKQEDKT